MPEDRYKCAADSLAVSYDLISSSSDIRKTVLGVDATPAAAGSYSYRRTLDM